MGQENSHELCDPDTPSKTLSSRSIEGVAEFINNGPPKNIVVMTGAGISTSAGIPDFRSPGTGLYANLARLNLPYPEAVFDISYFREHPEPFYVLAKELHPGKFFPTVAHAFVALLEKKSALQMLFTQNIDTLERKAGVSEHNIVEAHGSFATQRCIDCKTAYPGDLMLKAVDAGTCPYCIVPQCNGLVKPDIVFFGESLPGSFFKHRDEPTRADLIIVMGTSLSVQPFASLPQLAPEGVPRVLINNEVVGGLGSRTDDVVVLGDCDEGVRKLADALGWSEELEQIHFDVGRKAVEKDAAQLTKQRKAMTKDEVLSAEIDQLVRDVDATLKISGDHEERVIEFLAKPSDKEGLTPTEEGPSSKTAGDSYPISTIVAPDFDAPSKIEPRTSEPPSTPRDKSALDAKTAPLMELAEKRAVSDPQSTSDPSLPHNMPADEPPLNSEKTI